MSDRYRVEQIDGRNITYALARGIGCVRVISLAEDVVQQSVLKEKDRHDSNVMPHFAEFDKLLVKIQLLKNKTNRAARKTHLEMLSDPRLRTYALVDTQSESMVACAEWALPSYVHPPFKVSAIKRLYIFLLRIWYGILDRLHPSVSLKPVMDIYREAARRMGVHVEDIDRQIEILQQKSYSELSKGIYPESLCYYLRIFGVRTDYHGEGLGKILLSVSLESLKKEAVKPPMLDGPAKLLWQAAPLAANFYRKMGCSEGPSTTLEGLQHTVFYVNID